VLLHISGDALGMEELIKLHEAMLALFTDVDTMNEQFSSIGTGIAALPGYLGLAYPPPPFPPPNGTDIDDASSDVLGDSESNIEAGGSAVNQETMIALVVFGVIFFLCAIAVGCYLYRSKKYADKQIKSGKMKPMKEAISSADEEAAGAAVKPAAKKAPVAEVAASAVPKGNSFYERAKGEGQGRSVSADAMAEADAALAMMDDPSDEGDDEAAPTGEGDDKEEAMVRRIAWIEYYVSKGELDKARELGWSGDMSFLGLNEDGTPKEADAAAGASGSQANMHRI